MRANIVSSINLSLHKSNNAFNSNYFKITKSGRTNHSANESNRADNTKSPNSTLFDKHILKTEENVVKQKQHS